MVGGDSLSPPKTGGGLLPSGDTCTTTECSGVVMVVGNDSLSLGSAAPPTTGGGLLPSGDTCTTTNSSAVEMVVIHSPWAQVHLRPLEGAYYCGMTLVEEEEWDSPCPHSLMYPDLVESCL